MKFSDPTTAFEYLGVPYIGMLVRGHCQTCFNFRFRILISKFRSNLANDSLPCSAVSLNAEMAADLAISLPVFRRVEYCDVERIVKDVIRPTEQLDLTSGVVNSGFKLGIGFLYFRNDCTK